MSWRRVLGEPLVHFLAAGAVLFGLSLLAGESWGLGDGRDRIHVSAGKIRQLRETWTRRWGAEPTADQLRDVVDDFVREEVLYREAIASGLDRDDVVVRRRLAQKVEFLAQNVAAAVAPSDAELQEYFKRHVQRYAIPEQVGFSHVYFSRSTRGADAERAAQDALAGLRSGRITAAETSRLGDRFMLQSEYPPQTQAQIRDLFGAEFAARVFDLPANEWAGPVPSSYGEHLVHVRLRVASRVPDMGEVRRQLVRDFEDERLRSAADRHYESLRGRYDVDVDEAALAAPRAPRAP